MQELKVLLEERGRLYKSDFVAMSLGEFKRDRFSDVVYPLGGHPMENESPTSFYKYRRSYIEAYTYSDPDKSKR